MKRLLTRTVTILGLLVGSLASLVATAHTPLSSSIPREGAVLAHNATPKHLELRFVHALRLTSVSLQSVGGKKLVLKPARKAAPMHRVDLPALSPGDYAAEWRGMATDGHVMSGVIRFKVAGH